MYQGIEKALSKSVQWCE